MPITIHCLCNKTFQVPDELAGKRIKCGKCGRPHRVPVASPSSSPEGGVFGMLDESEIAPQPRPTCPSCQRKLKPGAVICVDCGVNVHTGEKLIVIATEIPERDFAPPSNSRFSAAAHHLRGLLIGLAMGIGIGLAGVVAGILVAPILRFTMTPLTGRGENQVIGESFELGRGRVERVIIDVPRGYGKLPSKATASWDESKKDWENVNERVDRSSMNGTDFVVAFLLPGIVGIIMGSIVGYFVGGTPTHAKLGAAAGAIAGCVDVWITLEMWSSPPAPWTFFVTAVAAGIVVGPVRG